MPNATNGRERVMVPWFLKYSGDWNVESWNAGKPILHEAKWTRHERAKPIEKLSKRYAIKGV
jgi:hypothetical protein